jgi:hypothetical protein
MNKCLVAALAVAALAKAVQGGNGFEGFDEASKEVAHVLALERIQDLSVPREVGKVAL